MPVATHPERMKDFSANEKVYELLFKSDELDWKSIIKELIRKEEMDPWDIDVSVIADKFMEILEDMREFDFRISGKIVLAAAFFLKIKSDRLLGQDIEVLDNMIEDPEPFDEFFDIMDEMEDESQKFVEDEPSLKTRTPQPRKRKVSVDDLVNSLEKALELEKKKDIKKKLEEAQKQDVEKPDKQKDITVVITETYDEIKKTLNKVESIKFNQLLKDDDREDRIYTFRPLLHLENERKIDMHQEEHFGEIEIELSKLKEEYENHEKE